MAQLESLLNPKSVALIGVSRNAEESVFHSLKTLKRYGYGGKIYVVHPKAEEILGHRVLKSMSDLPDDVDVLVVTLPKRAVLQTVKDAVAKHVKHVVIVTQGFADLDHEGKLLQEEIVSVARFSGTRILGPNTLGVSNSFSRFTTVISPLEWETPIPVAWICQTGVFVVGFSKEMGKRIDLGNGSDIQFEEALQHFRADTEMKLINVQIESLRNGRGFMEAVRETVPKKPVFVLKSGRTKLSALATASHSGALAGEDEVYDAAFRQCGAIRVDDLDEISDLNRAFLQLPPMAGRNIAVLTVSGGIGIIAMDACERYGLGIADLSPETISRLKQLSPNWVTISNPVDIWPGMSVNGYERVYREALEALTNDNNVHGILCILYAFDFQANPEIDVRPVLAEFTGKSSKPIVTWYYGPFADQMQEGFTKRNDIVPFSSPGRAMRALSVMHLYENLAKGKSIESQVKFPEVPAEAKKKISEIIEWAKKSGLGALGSRALDIIKLYGIPTAESRFAASLEDAIEAAKSIGFPLALKLVSPDASHKSDIGGVRLNIEGFEQLTREYRQILADLKAKSPDIQIDGVLLQRMVKGKEVIIGIKNDPSFGPIVVYGMGGIYTEVLKDVSFRVAPVSFEEAVKMIEETKSFAILSGARGQNPVNIATISDTIVRLSCLAMDFVEISELDLNPFIVSSEGGLAVDARMYLNQTAK